MQRTLLLLSYSKKSTSTFSNPTLISQQPPPSRQDPLSAKRLQVAQGSELRGALAFFSNKVSLLKEVQCFFRHNVATHFVGYSAVWMELLYAPGSQRRHDSLCCDTECLHWSGKQTHSMSKVCLQRGSMHSMDGQGPAVQHRQLWSMSCHKPSWKRVF